MRLLAIWIDQRSGFKTAKKIIVIHVSYIENDILEQKKITGSGLEGTQKLLKAFSRDYFYVKTMRHSRFQLGQFFVH